MYFSTSNQRCPHRFCRNYGKSGDEFISVHDKRLGRLRCKSCGKTWSAHCGNFRYGLRTEFTKINRAVDMLMAGMPVRVAARLAKVSPSTVMRWKTKLANRI